MKKFHIKISNVVILSCILTTFVTIAVVMIAYLPISKRTCRESIYQQMDAILNGRVSTIKEYVKASELVLMQYGTAPCIKDALMDQENAEKVAKAQAYTETYYSHLSGWEGVYASDWDTVVKVHSTPAVVGMQTRKGDDLIPYRETMTNSADGLYDGGAFISPASQQMILNPRMEICDDANNPIGLVGGGPFLTSLAGSLEDA